MADFDSALKVRQDDPNKLQATVKGFGAAGAPDAGVVTVQGIDNMKPLLVTVTNPDDQDPNGCPVGTSRNAAEGSAAAVAIDADAEVVSLAFAQAGYLRGFVGSASGKAKFTLYKGTDWAAAQLAGPIAAPAFATTASPTAPRAFTTPVPVAAGESVFLRGLNLDREAQDLYGEIDGYQADA